VNPNLTGLLAGLLIFVSPGAALADDGGMVEAN